MGCSMHTAYEDASPFANSLTPLCTQLTESCRLSLVSECCFIAIIIFLHLRRLETFV